MNKNFYDGEYDLRYPEVGVCLEDTFDGYVYRTWAKIAIPILTPTLPDNAPYDNRDPYVSTHNIVSDTRAMDITPCTTSNYIVLNLPDGIKRLTKGEKVTLQFVGGDINAPYIAGRYVNGTI